MLLPQKDGAAPAPSPLPALATPVVHTTYPLPSLPPYETREIRAYRTRSAVASALLVAVVYMVVLLVVDLDDGVVLNPLPFLILMIFPFGCWPLDTTVEVVPAGGRGHGGGGGGSDVWIWGCPDDCCP